MSLGEIGDGFVEFFVEDEDEGGSNTSEDIAHGSLEERFHSSFVGVDLLEAVDSSSVEDFLSSGLHHKSSSDGVQRITYNSGNSSNELSKYESSDKRCFLFSENHLSSRIVSSEVTGSVNDNSHHRNSKSLV